MTLNDMSDASGLRAYLSGPARRELEALRAALDTRLLALEKALAHPDPNESIEGLIIDLARVASDEAHTASAHKWLEAQLKAQEAAARAPKRTSEIAPAHGGEGIQGALIQ